MASGKKGSKGVFITLEGGDGAGKSTQITLLRQRLVEAGYEVVSSREPGGTERAENIRGFLLSGKAETLGPEFEATLFTAARLDHIEKLIAPAIADGKIVLCDRFIDSTRAYQGREGKVGSDYLDILEVLVRDIAWPDMTLVLDINPKESIKRAKARRKDKAEPDRFEKESSAIQKERRATFLAIAKSEPRRCKVVDASGNADAVHARIWKLVSPLIKRRMGKGSG